MRPPGGEEASGERALNDAEISAFWSRLDDTGLSLPIRLALRFILVTAQRKGEVAHGRWEEIDRDAMVWTIPGERSKNGLAVLEPGARERQMQALLADRD